MIIVIINLKDSLKSTFFGGTTIVGKHINMG